MPQFKKLILSRQTLRYISDRLREYEVQAVVLVELNKPKRATPNTLYLLTMS